LASALFFDSSGRLSISSAAACCTAAHALEHLSRSLAGFRAGGDDEGGAGALPFRSQERFRYITRMADTYGGGYKRYRYDRKRS
jgi:hypothetical protein